MRIFLSGGVKTQNIVTGIAKKFQASGDEFIVEKYMDNVEDIFTRGDYFDKAVITEQSITKEFSITDETQIRQRVNEFANKMANYRPKASYVFLTQDENLACMIHEEILPIINTSVVLLQGPPYSVQFFVEIIVNDVNQINKNYVYQPPEITGFAFDEEEQSYNEGDSQFDESGDWGNEEVPTEYNEPIAYDEDGNGYDIRREYDEEDSLFGNDFDTANNWQNQDSDEEGFEMSPEDGWGNEEELQMNPEDGWEDDSNTFDTENNLSGDGWDTQEYDTNQSPFSYSQEDNQYEEGLDADNTVFDEEYNVDGVNEQFDDYENIKVSSNFLTKQDENETNMEQNVVVSPNFLDKQEYQEETEEYWEDNNSNQDYNEELDSQQFNNNYNQNEQFQEEAQNNFIPGFDDNDYNSENNQDDLYGEYTEAPIDNTPMNNGFDSNDYSNQASGFDDSDYENNNVAMQGNIIQDNGVQGFDYDDYGTQPNNEQPYQMNNDTNNVNVAPQTINANDYIQDNHNTGALEATSLLGAGVISGQMIGNNQQMGQLPQQQINNDSGKKGIFGGFGRKKAQQNQQYIPQAQNGISGGPVVAPPPANSSININKLKDDLKPFASRGNSIVVTGCGGCGTSTIAYSLANIISQLGYTVLLVDMDTEGRTQNYISKANYDSMEPDGANLMSAVNSTNGINAQISVVKQGFHLLSMGIGADVAPVEELLHKERLGRFTNLAKSSHNFVIYDIPFKSATGFLSEVLYMCDNLVLVTDASNWGVTKTMLSVCNIANDDMQDLVFSRAQFVFNKYRNLNRVLGHKVRTANDILKVMDKKVLELVEDDPGFYFEQLPISGVINDDPNFEEGWFENVQYSDTKIGQQIFLELLERIVLKK